MTPDRPTTPALTRRRWLTAGAALVSGCVEMGAPRRHGLDAREVLWLDRLTWGACERDAAQLRRLGLDAWREQQLRSAGPAATLPDSLQAQVAQLSVTQEDPTALARRMEARRAAAFAVTDPDGRARALGEWGREMTRLARESQSRLLWRAVASPRQLQSQLGWFWLNHFSVFQHKANARVTLADLEDRLFTGALGSFRDLLTSVVFHPAMLLYLDNGQNTADQLNENLGRELLELHTLGVDGGYTQADVRSAARVLTGLGYARQDATPPLSPALHAQYRRIGLVEFHPQRHDRAPKTFLGAPLTAQGIDEIHQLLDRLAAHPSTARHVCRRLALYMMGDPPDEATLSRLAARFLDSGGRIDAVLRVLFTQPAFEDSLGRGFKDPTHWLVSALRTGLDERDPGVPDGNTLVAWLQRLGQAPYDRLTPDGYPLERSAWSAPGQLTARFDVARQISAGWPSLWRGVPTRAVPTLTDRLQAQERAQALSTSTLDVLSQAASPAERLALWLSSPEFMRR